MQALWPDGTTCDEDEVEDYLAFMSDDYELVNDDYDWLTG